LSDFFSLRSVIGNPENTDRLGLHCRASDPNGAGSLDTFWRSVENIKSQVMISPMNGDGNSESQCKGMMWAVSQAAPLRRVMIDGPLFLFDYLLQPNQCNYASGGYLGNVKVSDHIQLGSQQQFCLRNCTAKNFSGH
jgi:hypothetical protein